MGKLCQRLLGQPSCGRPSLGQRSFCAVAGFLVLVTAVPGFGAPNPEELKIDWGSIQFIESWPVETELDLPDLPEASTFWLDMVRSARTSIDIETFYFSSRPEGWGALAPILASLEEAANRGVRLRVISDAGFFATYPEIPTRLGQFPGAESVLLDARELWGGVQHAKWFLVDEDQIFLGSQNWDWRALEHIRELGVWIKHRALAQEMGRIFALDWALAHGDTATARILRNDSTQTAISGLLISLFAPRSAQEEPKRVKPTLAASPPQALPAGIPWDEPLLVELMDSAQSDLRLQLLSYNPSDREGRFYEVLDNGLRRAAARGVQVKIILSNWAKRHYMLPYIQSLAALSNVEIKFSNIPSWSGGFIPYARVEHAKYLVADSTHCWLGTANWARSYFHSSRNVSLFLAGEWAGSSLIEFFAKSWHSAYTEEVDPCGQYEPPRIGK